MKILHVNWLKILVLSLSLLIAFNQTVVDADKICGCEELLLEGECKLFGKCSFTNSQCVTLACNKIYTKTGCLQNDNCAWNNNECSDFVSCTSYNARTETECDNLNHRCYYNTTSYVCQAPLAPITTSCSSNTLDFCYVGKEGVCALNGQTSCREMTTCSEGNGNILRCYLAWPACDWISTTSICSSAMTCSEAYSNNCQFAKKQINGNEYYLCNKTDCSDFQPSKQTNATCLLNSLGYYHWKNETCTSCGGYSNSLKLAISLLSLLALIM